MRRQARVSAGGALVVRSASALQVWLWLLIFIFQNEFRISRSIQPGYLDFDNLPETNFTCAGKVIGGYYADLETSCQMFHVCTVGQQDEPMDIKFLCLNGTVFDQETRVCERVDEVDCTKSERFYSLNLELYGSTAPPIIEEGQNKPQAQPTEQSQQSKPIHKGESDPSIDESPTTSNDKTQDHLSDVIDSTEDPIQENKKDDIKLSHDVSTTHSLPIDHEEEAEEYQDEIDSENLEYEEEYSNLPVTTTTQAPSTTTVSTTTTTTTTTRTTSRPPPTTTVLPTPIPPHLPQVLHLTSSPLPTITSIPQSTISSSSPSVQTKPSLDPALLSPQEFIYHHRGPGSEAISFQRQTYRPADGVYITHAPPQQFDHFQYESSRTAPRPAQSRPAPFMPRPQPAPYRLTTTDPGNQLLRPGPTSQSSERHETTVKHRIQSYPNALPAQRPLPFNPYYFDRKRSDDVGPEDESSLTARSVAPPSVTERPPTKPKSPPRVIVTASASVSDSNGKRLNYTVGNVVSAVKPIVPINYDDYKESDLIFDPFFLDVPKLQKRRKTRSNNKVFAVPATPTASSDYVTYKTTISSPINSDIITTGKAYTVTPTVTTIKSKATTSNTWNFNDYVDDNYEPQAYVPPIPPFAVLVDRENEQNKFRKQEHLNKFPENDKLQHQLRSKVEHSEQYGPTLPTVQITSSQIEGAGTASPASPPPRRPPPLEALSCANMRSNDCQTRA